MILNTLLTLNTLVKENVSLSCVIVPLQHSIFKFGRGNKRKNLFYYLWWTIASKQTMSLEMSDGNVNKF